MGKSDHIFIQNRETSFLKMILSIEYDLCSIAFFKKSYHTFHSCYIYIYLYSQLNFENKINTIDASNRVIVSNNYRYDL